MPFRIPVQVPESVSSHTGTLMLVEEGAGDMAVPHILDEETLDDGMWDPRSAGLSVIERVLAPMACAE